MPPTSPDQSQMLTLEEAEEAASLAANVKVRPEDFAAALQLVLEGRGEAPSLSKDTEVRIPEDPTQESYEDLARNLVIHAKNLGPRVAALHMHIDRARRAAGGVSLPEYEQMSHEGINVLRDTKQQSIMELREAIALAGEIYRTLEFDPQSIRGIELARQRAAYDQLRNIVRVCLEDLRALGAEDLGDLEDIHAEMNAGFRSARDLEERQSENLRPKRYGSWTGTAGAGT